MAIFTLTSRDLNDPSFVVPAPLAGSLSQRDWSYVCERLRSVDAEAFCCALICSFILCICITPIAFVLCPCIYQFRVTTEKRRIINELNATVFQGRPVLDLQFNNVIINTDFLPGAAVMAQSQYAAQAQTVQPVIISNEYVQYASAGAQHQQYAQAQQPGVSQYAPPGAKAAAAAGQGGYAYAQQQPVMASAEPSYPPLAAAVPAVPTAASPAMSPSYTPQPAAAPAPATQQQRMMAFRVPEGVAAGALIRVMSPANTAVDVTVPEGVRSGEEILVPF